MFAVVRCWPCKDPSLYALDRQFNYEIYRLGQWVGRYGEGATTVILHFEDSQETLRQLSQEIGL